MSTLNNYNKLLKFMYDEFNRGNNASGYGEYIQELIDQFEHSSPGNRIGSAQAKTEATRYFLQNGLIDAVDALGHKITNSLLAHARGRMQPTQKGAEYLKQTRIGRAKKAAPASETFFGKLFKPFFRKR